MKEKEEIKDIYENLTEENKNILNMVAQGMAIAQNQIVENNEEHIPHVD